MENLINEITKEVKQNKFQKAINKKVVGGIDGLTEAQRIHYEGLLAAKKYIESTKNLNTYYVLCYPLNFVERLLMYEKFKNNSGAECVITKVYRKKKSGDILVDVKTNDGRYRCKQWTMCLSTILTQCYFTSLNEKKMVFFKNINNNNKQYYLRKVDELLENYNKRFTQQIGDASRTIQDELKNNPSEIEITRSAMRRTLKSIEKDEMEIRKAWNSTLTLEEQTTLMNWIKVNVYSMRLYVIKNSSWDKVISERYPDEQYGLKRRTEASESSTDSISGYISVKQIADAPMEIIKKLTHKVKDEDNFKKNAGSNVYRLNNYLLVLFLLNNYNSIGFKTGVRNLSNYITA